VPVDVLDPGALERRQEGAVARLDGALADQPPPQPLASFLRQLRG